MSKLDDIFNKYMGGEWNGNMKEDIKSLFKTEIKLWEDEEYITIDELLEQVEKL